MQHARVVSPLSSSSPGPAGLALVAFAALLAAAPVDAAAQSHPPAQARPVPLLDRAEERALALSAAPPEVANGASVWVLEKGGYARDREGGNGWTCLVERDHPESLAPVCYDPAGATSVLPAVLELARLRQGGATYAAAKERVLAELRAGRLPSPERPVLSLMTSPAQRLYSGPDGEPIGAWLPHVMIHFPGLENDAMGLEPGGALGWVQDDGLATSYLVIPVARWSDGTEAPRGGG